MYSYLTVDVFTDKPLVGNPVAVFTDGTGLSDEQMQGIAAWLNLSETTFLLPPTQAGADYAVRIFTPTVELPFAGHPTLGSAHAWLEAGGVPQSSTSEIVQECGVGLVSLRRSESGALAFRAPELNRSGMLPEEDLVQIAGGLGLKAQQIVAHQWCDNGPPWQCLLLDDADTMLSVTPNAEILQGRFVGLVAPSAAGSGTDFEVRAFFPGASGIVEDPVTGSLNAAIGQWFTGAGISGPSYTARQGTALGRDGRIRVHRDDEGVWVGGDTVTVLRGQADLPL